MDAEDKQAGVLSLGLREGRLCRRQVAFGVAVVRRQPQRPVAVLTMRFLFFDRPNGLLGRVLLEREYARSIPLKSATPAALMEGWNQALTQVLTQVISDFRHSEVPISTLSQF